MPTRSRGLAAALLACFAAGCVGEIGTGRSAPGDDPPSPGKPSDRPTDPTPPTSTGSTGPGDPGRVTVRRLNRIEYDNTLRDLLGTTSRPAQAFEMDPSGFGYDNNGDVQTLTTLQIEHYQNAAEAAIGDVTTGGLDKLAAAARVPVCALADAACSQRLVAGLARRAWRRPVTDAEVDRVMALARDAGMRGEDPLAQLRAALVALLASPHFLFRVELDPDPRSLVPHPVAPYEMASRLSYLIYRSMPDDALFTAAGTGKLVTEADVRRET
jgi:hypothetical protein